MAKKGTSKWLRYLVNVWMFMLFLIMMIDFVSHNGFEYLIGPISAIYVGVLVIYSAEKEFERWAEYYEGRHPGELYVICWTFLIFFLIGGSFFSSFDYKLPPETISTYIAVISIMAFTQKSKKFFSGRRKRVEKEKVETVVEKIA